MNLNDCEYVLSFTEPSLKSSIILADLRSRCINWLSCRKSRANRICWQMYATWSSSNLWTATAWSDAISIVYEQKCSGRRVRTCVSVPPCMYSVINHISSPTKYDLRYLIILGCFAYCRNRISCEREVSQLALTCIKRIFIEPKLTWKFLRCCLLVTWGIRLTAIFPLSLTDLTMNTRPNPLPMNLC